MHGINTASQIISNMHVTIFPWVLLANEQNWAATPSFSSMTQDLEVILFTDVNTKFIILAFLCSL